ncbi:MAG: hypothetical protein OXE84_05295 [Rhodobacteraceae bacterium]|nr:hypothetical protein [Paracoccaceae bacterium]MCY4197200.1 hypothetical protein [Paracoccaceae bacterium]
MFTDPANGLLQEVRDAENLHDDVVTLWVSRDGTMLGRHEDKRDGQATEHGWCEAVCGVVAQLSSTGEILIPRTVRSQCHRMQDQKTRVMSASPLAAVPSKRHIP